MEEKTEETSVVSLAPRRRERGANTAHEKLDAWLARADEVLNGPPPPDAA